MGDVSLNPQPLINDETLTFAATAAKQDNQFRDLMSSEWTNERHRSYISYMEASFVDQLYGHPNHGLDVNKRHPGDKGFKVIQEGVCKNTRFEGPWVRRFRPHSTGASRSEAMVGADDYGSGTDTVREKVRTHGREVKTCARQNLIEVSDQNFPDKEVDTSNEPSKKQRPTSSSAAPNDLGT